MSALAEKPERIKKLFIDKQANEQGIYSVKLCKNGLQFQIVLDEFIPVVGDKPAFAQSKNGELWPVILEKAWAKVHGSYERIEGGQSHMTMRDLTGAPAFDYDILKTPNIFDIILEADSKNFIITAGCDHDDENSI